MTDQFLWFQVQRNSYSRNCRGCWISKMLFDTLERYAIKFCFKLEKNATETYGMFQTDFGPSCMNRAPVFEWHMRFMSIHQSWLVKRLGLGLLCWFLREFRKIPREEASTLQIRSVAFPPGQCTSLQFHSCHRLFDQDGHQDSTPPSLKSRPCSLWLSVIT